MSRSGNRPGVPCAGILQQFAASPSDLTGSLQTLAGAPMAAAPIAAAGVPQLATLIPAIPAAALPALPAAGTGHTGCCGSDGSHLDCGGRCACTRCGGSSPSGSANDGSPDAASRRTPAAD
ncbi:MAG: hypothetical protein ACRDU5_05160 [Mycobacterium sp.]